jgi:alpha-mannosidase
MDWSDQQKPSRSYVGGPAKVRVVENGPVRVALEIERETEGSKFVQTIRLSAGDAGNRVEFVNDIDWRTREAALKATFPLVASNENATYNWDVGTIERSTDNEKKFEFPSHQWFDLTDKSGHDGVTVLSDCKYGSDKPDDHTLRLTLIYTPGVQTWSAYDDQTTQDFGHHQILYGLAAHDGDWRQGRTDWQGYRLNQPLIAFISSKHEGHLGKEFSLLKIDQPNIRVLALKKAENSDDIVVRMVETEGRKSGVNVSFVAPVAAAREINGQEMPYGPVAVNHGEITVPFAAFQLHTFAVKLAPTTAKIAPPSSQPVPLKYEISVATTTGKPAEGCFDCDLQDPTAEGQGHAIPAEMLPETITFNGINFRLGPNGKNDAVIARGQNIALPQANFNRVYVLAAAYGGDQAATIEIDGKPTDVTIPEWTNFVGQWDNRILSKRMEAVPGQDGKAATQREVTDFHGVITPGYIKRADIAWYASHRHDTNGSNEPYSYSYLFAFPIDLPEGAKTLTLPSNEKIRILAITVAHNSADAEAAQPLYDVLGNWGEKSKPANQASLQ